VLLAIRSMAGESEPAWRALLDDLMKRGLTTPELAIPDSATGLERTLGRCGPSRLDCQESCDPRAVFAKDGLFDDEESVGGTRSKMRR
jgi:hypothetical protein